MKHIIYCVALIAAAATFVGCTASRNHHSRQSVHSDSVAQIDAVEVKQSVDMSEMMLQIDSPLIVAYRAPDSSVVVMQARRAVVGRRQTVAAESVKMEQNSVAVEQSCDSNSSSEAEASVASTHWLRLSLIISAIVLLIFILCCVRKN